MVVYSVLRPFLPVIKQSQTSGVRLHAQAITRALSSSAITNILDH